MSDSATAEREHVADLEGIDLGGVPPCGMGYVHVITRQRVPCGKPSVSRVHVECPCGFSHAVFICKECLDDLKNGKISCLRCYRPFTSWRET